MRPFTLSLRAPRVHVSLEPGVSVHVRSLQTDGAGVSPSLVVVRLRLARALGRAFRVDLADLLEGTGQRVQVSGGLVPSLPQAEDDPGRAALLREIRQVPEEGNENTTSQTIFFFYLHHIF